MRFHPDGRRGSEVVWNDSRRYDQYSKAPGGPWGGSGGSSRVYGLPPWQRSAVQGSHRAVPDVAANAADVLGEPVFGLQGLSPIGGTSASTPLTAAGVGLLNAHRMSQGQPPLGYLNPWLYSLAGDGFFDVVAGNNDLYEVGCCRAHAGYDRASGIGVPDYSRLARQLPVAG